MYRKFKLTEMRVIRNKILNGKSRHVVAKEHGVPYTTLNNRLFADEFRMTEIIFEKKKEKFGDKILEMRKNGVSVKKISKKYGLTTYFVQKIIDLNKENGQ